MTRNANGSGAAAVIWTPMVQQRVSKEILALAKRHRLDDKHAEGLMLEVMASGCTPLEARAEALRLLHKAKPVDVAERSEIPIDPKLYEQAERLSRNLRPRRRSRRTRLPRGMIEMQPGWLVPVKPASAVECLPLVLWLERQAPEHDAVRLVSRNVSASVARELGAKINGSGLERAWETVLSAALWVGRCVSRDNTLHSADGVVRFMRQLLREHLAELPGGTGSSLVPEGLTPGRLAMITGDHLERVTPARRGGGGLKSVDAVVLRLRRELKRDALERADSMAVREVIMTSPGVGGVEQIRRALKMRVQRVRRALSRLEAAKVVENRGTEQHPKLYFVG